MFSKEAALLKQIDESRNAIRQKHLQLKHGLRDVQDEVSKVFKPIVQPLNKMANEKVTKKVVDRSPKIQTLPKIEKNIYHSTPWKLGQQLSFGNTLTKYEEFEKKSHDHDDGDDDDDDEDDGETKKSKLNDGDDDDDDDGDDDEYDDFQTVNQSSFIDKNGIQEPKPVADFLHLIDSGDTGMDTTYGVRRYSKEEYRIGSERFDHDDDKIYVKGKPYLKTPGLLELLFKKKPNEKLIEDSDIKNYQKIALETNLLRKSYKPDKSFKTMMFNAKYLKYLRKLNPDHVRNSRIGKGLPKFMIAKARDPSLDYKYWDSPNELVDRLRLLMAEKSAGNNNHDNEIQAIIEELREAKIIY